MNIPSTIVESLKLHEKTECRFSHKWARDVIKQFLEFNFAQDHTALVDRGGAKSRPSDGMGEEWNVIFNNPEISRFVSII